MPSRFRFCERTGNPGAPWKDINLTNATVTVALGEPEQPCAAGTFDLTVNGSGTSVSDLAAGITASALQTALNANANMSGQGGCVVTAMPDGVSYRIVLNTVGNGVTLAGSATGLIPNGEVLVQQLTTGAGVNESYILTVRRAAYASVQSTGDYATGAATITEVQAGSATRKEVQSITFNVGAYDGTYTLNWTKAAQYTVTASANTGGALEVSTVTFVNDTGGNKNGHYFDVYEDPINVRRVYLYNGVTDIVPPTPANGSVTRVTYANGDTASTIAPAVQAAVDALAQFTASVAGAIVTISTVVKADVPSISGNADFTYAVVQAGSNPALTGKYFSVPGNNEIVGIWMNTGGQQQPSDADATRWIEVTATSATASGIASAIQTAVDADAAFAASVSGAKVTITDSTGGARETSIDAQNSGFGVLRTVAGGSVTGTVPFNATEEQIELALDNNWQAKRKSNGFTLTNRIPGDVALIAIDITQLIFADAVDVQLNLSTANMTYAFAETDDDELTLTYQVRIQYSGGQPVTIYKERIKVDRSVILTGGSVSSSIASAIGLTDGDKGDITVSASGATWTADPTIISGKTADASPDGASDYALVLDTSTNTLKKVLLDDLPGGGGSSSIATGNLVYVDVDGNDGTGLRERFDKPFLTIEAAEAAATSGDTIQIRSGSYSPTATLGKVGITYELMPGVNISSAENDGTFGDSGSAKDFAIIGSGTITNTGSGGAVQLTAASNVTVRGDIVLDGSGTAAAYINAHASAVSYVNARRVASGNAALVNDGTCYFYADFIDARQGLSNSGTCYFAFQNAASGSAPAGAWADIYGGTAHIKGQYLTLSVLPSGTPQGLALDHAGTKTIWDVAQTVVNVNYNALGVSASGLVVMPCDIRTPSGSYFAIKAASSTAVTIAGYVTSNANVSNITYNQGAVLTTQALVGTVGTTDNRLLRGDGTGGYTLQNSTLGLTDETVYSSQYYIALKAEGAQTNNHVVVCTRGTGAFILGPVPDGSSTGGNNRGTYAIDLQLERSGATQVASGSGAVAIGSRCTSSASGSVAIGFNAVAGSSSYAVAIGKDCTSTASDGSVAMGVGCTASSFHAVAMGGSCSATAVASTASGLNSAASGNGSVAMGNGCGASATGTAAFGHTASSSRHGMLSFAGGAFSSGGDAQQIIYVQRIRTTSTSPTLLRSDGSSVNFTIPSGKAISGYIVVIAKQASSANACSYHITFTAVNNGGTSTLPQSAVTALYESNASANCTIAVDDATDSIQLTWTAPDTNQWDVVSVGYCAEVV